MRSVSQIYSEAVTVRNNYLQLTELNTGRSKSKLSIINLLTYVMAVCIHTYEATLDLFQVRIAEVLNGRINGTPDWYAMIAKKFQFNSVTEMGDPLQFNEDTMKIEYINPNPANRIIEKAAWQTDEESNALILKVCKANENSGEIDNGIPYMPLNDNELTAFKMFIQQIKFVGAEVYSESTPGDIMTIVADTGNPIFYDDSFVTASQALTSLRKELIDFVNSMEFNGYLYYQSVLDVIRKTEHISYIGNSIKIYVTPYDTAGRRYGEPIELKSRMRLKSGYVRLLDENSANTVNSDNLTFVPVSRMDKYYSDLNIE